MRQSIFIAAALFLLGGSAHAGTSADIAVKALESGALADGISALSPIADGDSTEAKFGLGLLTFAKGIEGLMQALYKHGLAAPEAGPMGPSMLLPVPDNPNPAPLDYSGVRDILQDFVTAMDAARAELEAAGAAGDYVLMVDPLKIRIDIDADGKADDSESVAGVISRLFGVPREQLGALVPDVASDGGAPSADGMTPAFGLDRADAYWLAGYSQVLAAQADFLLAHDFSELVNATFHRLFPKAGFPLQDVTGRGSIMMDPETDNGIADLVAGFHSINWPVTDPARLAGVRERLKSVLALSRQNWAAIATETDDNHELVPSPAQTSQLPESAVTQQKIDAWLKTLDTADDILDGKLLVPHWRFSKGFDLDAYFKTARRTDLVMLLTGSGALPYLKDGPIASRESFQAANAAFGEQFIGYAFWFN